MTRPPLDAIEFDQTWFRAQGQAGGLPFHIRGRQKLAEVVAHPELRHRVVLTLTFGTEGASSLPTPAQYAQLDRFESDVIDRLEQLRVALLSFARTGQGKVEYHLYARDPDHVVGILDAHCPSETKGQLAVAAVEEPDWREYLCMLKGCGMSIEGG